MSDFVRNQAELATALGVSRQLIGWHVKKAGSPIRRADGRYCVSEWLKYFEVNGRLDMRRRDPDNKDNILREALRPMPESDRVIILALCYFSKYLPQCVDSALLHTKVSQPKRNLITLRLWAALARIVVLGTGNPDDGTDIVPLVIPETIKDLAAKCKIQLTEAALESLLT